uniref:Uncharacterized protein n=1 Tax=Melanopsichium pennsylvanicum 4 TaxID=1398559 RepID=A0A077R2E7_9BASI|nr:uncharacterized protein BN887_06012 [Melanopsichium pennsylvanicum 4]
MNAGCSTAASAPPLSAAPTSTTPPLVATQASSAAHYRLGRTSRRRRRSSSSSGASSSSANGVTLNTSNGAHIKSKRRRHSTLSNGIASGSEEEGDRAPPTFRLRLGSYVSDFRLRHRSHSPGQGPASPSTMVRPKHQLRIHTTTPVQQSSWVSQDQVSAIPSAVSPTTIPSTSNLTQRADVVDMDLDLDHLRSIEKTIRETQSRRKREEEANRAKIHALESSLNELRKQSTRQAADWRSLAQHAETIEKLDNRNFDLAKKINEQEGVLNGMQTQVLELKRLMEECEAVDVEDSVEMDKDA